MSVKYMTENLRLIIMNDNDELNETLNSIKELYERYILNGYTFSVFTPKESFVYCFMDYLKETFETRIYDIKETIKSYDDENGLMLLYSIIESGMADIDYKVVALDLINYFLENENIKLELEGI